MQYISFYKDRLPFKPKSNVVIYFDVMGIGMKLYYHVLNRFYDRIVDEFHRGGLSSVICPKSPPIWILRNSTATSIHRQARGIFYLMLTYIEMKLMKKKMMAARKFSAEFWKNASEPPFFHHPC